MKIIENIISVEDVTSRCKEIEKLNRKLEGCMADFREGNIVLSVIAEKIEF